MVLCDKFVAPKTVLTIVSSLIDPDLAFTKEVGLYPHLAKNQLSSACRVRMSEKSRDALKWLEVQVQWSSVQDCKCR